MFAFRLICCTFFLNFILSLSGLNIPWYHLYFFFRKKTPEVLHSFAVYKSISTWSSCACIKVLCKLPVKLSKVTFVCDVFLWHTNTFLHDVHLTPPITKKIYAEILPRYRRLFVKGDVFIGEWGIFGAEVFLVIADFSLKVTSL